MTTNIVKIEISDKAVRTVVAGAVIIGFLYLLYKLSDSQIAINLPESAEAFSHMPSVTPDSLDGIKYDAGIVTRISKLFNDGHYTFAAFEATKQLFSLIRKKACIETGEHDGAGLVEYVFVQKKILKFKPDPELGDLQRGLISGLTLVAKTIRDPAAHRPLNTDRHFSLMQITMICWLAYQVENNSVGEISCVEG